MNQSTALRIFSAYLPSLMVLPSMSRTMPPKAVMVVGYWPPLASQWPSRCCVFATQARPLLTTSLYLGSNSSARAGRANTTASAPISRVPEIELFMIGSSLFLWLLTVGWAESSRPTIRWCVPFGGPRRLGPPYEYEPHFFSMMAPPWRIFFESTPVPEDSL